jgi:hypothetical protein
MRLVPAVPDAVAGIGRDTPTRVWTRRSVPWGCCDERRTVLVIDVVTHLDVDRPAGAVFAFVRDQLNAPRWQRGLHEVRRTTDGPIGVGSEHVFVRRLAGRRIESRNRFVEFEPGRYAAFEIPDGAMTGRASYLVEPIDADRCHVTSTMRFNVAGRMRVAEPLLARVLARDSRRDEQVLKRLLESTPT